MNEDRNIISGGQISPSHKNFRVTRRSISRRNIPGIIDHPPDKLSIYNPHLLGPQLLPKKSSRTLEPINPSTQVVPVFSPPLGVRKINVLARVLPKDTGEHASKTTESSQFRGTQI